MLLRRRGLDPFWELCARKLGYYGQLVHFTTSSDRLRKSELKLRHLLIICKQSGGTAWALQLDGIITRTGTDGGNMIFIEHGTDFEMFSSTGHGAIQGHGYIFHLEGSLDGPRLLRTYEMSNFSVHDFALVDSPSFHFSMDTCSSGEVYNMLIRGGDSGGLDGIDVWGSDTWIHDVMVTNKVL